MKSQQMTRSAVLFSDATYPEPVSWNWFENAVKVFELLRMAPIFFTAGGGDFELDDCWLLEDDGPGIFRWGDPEPIHPGRIALLKNLREGAIHTLALDSPPTMGMIAKNGVQASRLHPSQQNFMWASKRNSH